VRAAGETVRRTFVEIDAETPSAAAMIRVYAGRLAGWMEQSGWADGCPITTTLLETAADDEQMRIAGRAAFDGWTAVVAEALVRDGAGEVRARTLARLAISALEGALILARVDQNARAILAAGDEMAAIFARGG
jgi:TetR/AcrR family transcriptional repressor of lmrAB and yxaGH operons